MTEPEIPFVSRLRDEVTRATTREASRVSERLPGWSSGHGALRGCRRWPILTAGGLMLCAAIATLVILITAGASPQAAYALTRNPNGSITVTIRNVEKAIPALNVRFRQMHIDETVLPVKASCRAAQYFGYSNVPPSQTLTFDTGHQHLNPGYQGVLAVERLPNGHIAMSLGARRPPLPACVHAVVLNLKALRHAAHTKAPAR